MNQPSRGTTLGLFAKHWTPGTVKTRLAAALGNKAAAELHRAFLVRTLERFAGAAENCMLVFWPPEQRAAFQFAEASGWRLQAQSSGDLGERMKRFFDDVFSNGAARVILIGADSPTLPLDYLRLAFDALNDKEAVVGPATDGGYYLIGASRRVPPIFDQIPWSTPDVYRQTITRLEQTQTSYALLPEWYDVDEWPDLTRLHRDLEILANADAAWGLLRDNVKRTAARSPEARLPGQ